MSAAVKTLERNCILVHHREPDRARRAADGLRVCLGCRARIDDVLRRLPQMHDELLTVHVAASGGMKVAGTEDQIPYSDVVGDEREMIRWQLHLWALYVAQRRQIAAPPPGLDFAAQFLRIHAEWLLADDAAGDAAEELSERYRAAYALLHPSGVRRFVIVNTDGLPAPCLHCQGPLVAVLRHSDDLLPSKITCTECGEETPASQWITYARQLRRQAELLANATA